MINRGIAYIAEHFGLEAQLRQLQEECSELSVAASKFLRKRGQHSHMITTSFSESYDNLVEELADTLLVAYQIIDLLDCETQVLRNMAGKIERTTLRILEEKNDISNETAGSTSGDM